MLNIYGCLVEKLPFNLQSLILEKVIALSLPNTMIQVAFTSTSAEQMNFQNKDLV